MTASAEAVAAVVAAIRAGKPVLLPTDTVYGLCVDPYRDAPASRIYQLKSRDVMQPLALLAGDVEMLLECVPELRGRSGVIARALLPGPYTLVLPNPARRYRWLTGARPETIGVRVPALPESVRRVLAEVGAVAATSANASGGRDPSTLDDVPGAIREACAAELDGGRLGGVPSTVIDFTGPEPHVLREGAAPATEALERLAAALA